jgi:hypothetical protein
MNVILNRELCPCLWHKLCEGGLAVLLRVFFFPILYSSNNGKRPQTDLDLNGDSFVQNH